MHKELFRNDSLLAIGRPSVKSGHTTQIKRVAKNLKINISADSDEMQWSAIKTNDGKLRMTPLTLKRELVPDVSGMGLRDAVYILESHGLMVKATGRGSVVRQSIHAGTNINKGQQILIELS